jgi:hypothetical protein
MNQHPSQPSSSYQASKSSASKKGQALQLTSGLDCLSIQAYRLWMEHPSREKVNQRHSGCLVTLRNVPCGRRRSRLPS